MTVPVSRPGPRAHLVLFQAEGKSVMRDTAGLLVPIGLPVLILLVTGLSVADVVVPGSDGRTALELAVLPVTLTMVLALVGVVNLPSFLATYRTTGVLKRLAVTPVRPGMVLGAQIAVSVVQSVIGIGVAILAAWLVFGARAPEHAWTVIGVSVLAAAAMYGTGLLIAAVSPTPNASVAIGLVSFLLLGATGGMFGGADALPEPLARIGEALPFGAAVNAIGDAWRGTSVHPGHLVALAAAALIGTASALRFFRWR